MIPVVPQVLTHISSILTSFAMSATTLTFRNNTNMSTMPKYFPLHYVLFFIHRSHNNYVSSVTATTIRCDFNFFLSFIYKHLQLRNIVVKCGLLTTFRCCQSICTDSLHSSLIFFSLYIVHNLSHPALMMLTSVQRSLHSEIRQHIFLPSFTNGLCKKLIIIITVLIAPLLIRT